MEQIENDRPHMSDDDDARKARKQMRRLHSMYHQYMLDTAMDEARLKAKHGILTDAEFMDFYS